MRFADEARQKALEGLAHEEGVITYVAGHGTDILELASCEVAAADKWVPAALEHLLAGMTYLSLVARYHEATGTPKTNKDAGRTVDTPGTALSYSIWAAFLHVHFGCWNEARWLARYLLGYLDGGDVLVPSDKDDAEYHALSKLLLRTVANDTWPLDIPAEVGPYRELLQGRRNAAMVADALVRVADLRMARTQGYAQVDDARPLGPYAAPLLMANLLFVAVPAELWAIKALTLRLDGVELSLDADHPWLRAGFMLAPTAASPSYDDEVLQALRKFGDARFGAGWRNG